MKQTRFSQMQQKMLEKFGPEQGGRIARAMEKELEVLQRMYQDQPKSMVRHTTNNIFPVVSACRALESEGIADASEQAGNAFLELMEAPAQAIRRAMKVPGLYRLMPWLWKTMMPKLFSEDAGFRFRFYPHRKGRVKFDMLECPYYRVCRELGCSDLAPVFCTTDDICYGHMHKKLIWNRTRTLARGGDVCDFDLDIRE